MSTKDNMSVEQILLNVLFGTQRRFYYKKKWYGSEDTDLDADVAISEALAALNKLRREDMEFVIGKKSNPDGYDPDFITSNNLEDIKLDGQNELINEQTARMNQRLSGGKE